MLYTKKERSREHAAFLEWLLETIDKNSVDLLIIAGDVFDTASPGSTSQKMYYDFLVKVRNLGCNNVVIIGGNHDSPSFLNAPGGILSAMDVHVIGSACENIEDEVITITGADNQPAAIVCAVPFLRERDISRFTEKESYDDRSKRIKDGIRNHYEAVAAIAEAKRDEAGGNIPVIATGHLSVSGGKRYEDDGVRETYVGSIECIDSDIFPKTFDYVALGHYHVPSVISDRVRYCGSPIPMGFIEAGQKKCVCLVDFEQNIPDIRNLEIPVFQRLESISGDRETIGKRLSELKGSGESVWVEILYDGKDVFPDLTTWANEMTADSNVEILKIQNRMYLNEVLTQNEEIHSLDDLSKFDVFEKLLAKNDIPQEQRTGLLESYKEIIQELEIDK
jgi:exonuclease SbcD